jgi:hypothetical protein
LTGAEAEVEDNMAANIEHYLETLESVFTHSEYYFNDYL